MNKGIKSPAGTGKAVANAVTSIRIIADISKVIKIECEDHLSDNSLGVSKSSMISLNDVLVNSPGRYNNKAEQKEIIIVHRIGME